MLQVNSETSLSPVLAAGALAQVGARAGAAAGDSSDCASPPGYSAVILFLFLPPSPSAAQGSAVLLGKPATENQPLEKQVCFQLDQFPDPVH